VVFVELVCCYLIGYVSVIDCDLVKWVGLLLCYVWVGLVEIQFMFVECGDGLFEFVNIVNDGVLCVCLFDWWDLLFVGW